MTLCAKLVRDLTPEIEQACQHLHAGDVIAYPTEAVFGLGCDPLNAVALERVIAVKGRANHKGFIVVAGREEQLADLILPLADPVASHIRATWPGPVTWIVPAQSNIPDSLTGGRATIAVRVSAHPIIRSLCDCFGRAIVSTSANLSQEAELRTASEVRETFGASLQFIIDAPTGGSDTPSKIFEASTLKQLR